MSFFLARPQWCSRARVAFACATCLLAASALGAGCQARPSPPAPDSAAASATPRQASSSTSLPDEFWERSKQVFNVPLTGSPVRGPAEALVTIIEFSEFQCASCSALETTLDALRTKYGDKVRFVWKNKALPQQPAAEPAAEAALEVRAEKGDQAFWDMHDRLLQAGDTLLLGKSPNIASLVKIASAAGASADSIRNAIARHTHQEEIEQDLDLAEDFEVESTPALFVNGRRLDGVQPQARLERMVDEELLRAQELLAKGTPAKDLYEKLVAGGLGPWRPASKALTNVPAGDPALGGSKAKVTVHVWSDYQCALCVAVERALSDLHDEYGDRVRFVWHDLPLPRHEDALRIALAEREAYAQKGAPGFWAMHHAVSFDPHVPSASELEGFARSVKLDMNKWRSALDGNRHVGEIAADEKAARDNGITETPAFIVATGAASQGAFVGNIEYGSKLHRVVEAALDRE